MHSEIKFLPLLRPMKYFYKCLGSLLSTYILSCTHLAHISYISNFYCAFRNQISTSLKTYKVLLRMFRKPFKYIYIILHTSCTYLAHSKLLLCSKIEFLPLLSPLGCFYECFGSQLSTYVLSHTHLAYILHISHTYLAHSKL